MAALPNIPFPPVGSARIRNSLFPPLSAWDVLHQFLHGLPALRMQHVLKYGVTNHAPDDDDKHEAGGDASSDDGDDGDDGDERIIVAATPPASQPRPTAVKAAKAPLPVSAFGSHWGYPVGMQFTVPQQSCGPCVSFGSDDRGFGCGLSSMSQSGFDTWTAWQRFVRAQCPSCQQFDATYAAPLLHAASGSSVCPNPVASFLQQTRVEHTEEIDHAMLAVLQALQYEVQVNRTYVSVWRRPLERDSLRHPYPYSSAPAAASGSSSSSSSPPYTEAMAALVRDLSEAIEQVWSSVQRAHHEPLWVPNCRRTDCGESRHCLIPSLDGDEHDSRLNRLLFQSNPAQNAVFRTAILGWMHMASTDPTAALDYHVRLTEQWTLTSLEPRATSTTVSLVTVFGRAARPPRTDSGGGDAEEGWWPPLSLAVVECVDHGDPDHRRLALFRLDQLPSESFLIRRSQSYGTTKPFVWVSEAASSPTEAMHVPDALRRRPPVLQVSLNAIQTRADSTEMQLAFGLVPLEVCMKGFFLSREAADELFCGGPYLQHLLHVTHRVSVPHALSGVPVDFPTALSMETYTHREPLAMPFEAVLRTIHHPHRRPAALAAGSSVCVVTPSPIPRSFNPVALLDIAHHDAPGITVREFQYDLETEQWSTVRRGLRATYPTNVDTWSLHPSCATLGLMLVESTESAAPHERRPAAARPVPPTTTGTSTTTVSLATRWIQSNDSGLMTQMAVARLLDELYRPSDVHSRHWRVAMALARYSRLLRCSADPTASAPLSATQAKIATLLQSFGSDDDHHHASDESGETKNSPGSTRSTTSTAAPPQQHRHKRARDVDDAAGDDDDDKSVFKRTRVDDDRRDEAPARDDTTLEPDPDAWLQPK